MKRKYKILIIILGVVVVGVIAAVIGVNKLQANFNKQISGINITDVDLSKVPDGTFEGSYKALPIAAEVKVTVENHKITDIVLVKHENGQGKPAEVLPAKVVEAQSLKVDLVSGATYSSKVILMAIENALVSAIK